jgi:hypothetical protein
VETLTFTTATTKRRRQPLTVEFCGETITLQRPKDAVMFFSGVTIADMVADADRAAAILQFLQSVFEPADRHRFFERALDRDDPVNMRACLDLVAGAVEAWTNWPATGTPEPLVVEAAASDQAGEPVSVVHKDLGLELVCTPPKDLVLLFVTASLATGSRSGQLAWAVGLFLDAALTPADRMVVAQRMRNPDDDLDLDHIADIVKDLTEHWVPKPANRATRRAANRRRA